MAATAAGSAGKGEGVSRVTTNLIVGLLFSTFTIGCVRSEDWSYSDETGPEFWSVHYPNCGGEKQSPINLDSHSAITDDHLSLTLIHYDRIIDEKFNVTNNGHSVQVSVPRSAGVAIKHGQLPHIYTLAQFHFHWGSSDSFGSEHSLDNIVYPLEIHLVHYNSDLYPDVSTAANKTNGLAVLGILVRVNELADFPEIDDLISHFPEIPYEGDLTTMSSFSIESLLPASKGDFFRYSGSLTTPACYESVVWSVFRAQVDFTPDQLEKFRTLHSNVAGDPDEALVNNFRPTQPLNGRTVAKSF